MVVVSLLVFLGAYFIAVMRELEAYYGSYIDPILYLSLALFVISPFLFFVRDKVFLCWIRFAIVWLIVSGILIAFTPEYSGGWLSIEPGKEQVSVWLAQLFVPASLILLIWKSRKTPKKK